MVESAQDWATKNVPGAIDGARDLCLPQIKPEHIGDAVRPRLGDKECAGAIDGARDRRIFLQG